MDKKQEMGNSETVNSGISEPMVKNYPIASGKDFARDQDNECGAIRLSGRRV
jgi:hypothetical protein